MQFWDFEKSNLLRKPCFNSSVKSTGSLQAEMEQQKQKNEELQKKLQETAALQDPWDTCALSCAGITLDVLLVSGFLRNHILNHHISFCKDSKLASVWKDVKDYTQSFLFSIQYITSIYQLLQWLMLREEEVAKKREETEDLQKKLQEASAMQVGPFFLPLMRSTLWCRRTIIVRLYLQHVLMIILGFDGAGFYN